MSQPAPITVTLPDGKAMQLAAGATTLDLAAAIGPRLAKAAVAGKIGNDIIDLRTPLTDGATVRIVTDKDPEALAVLRHTTAHVMADAVQRLWPGTQVTIGPATDEGFYYDFDKKGGFTPDDLEKIAAVMREIIAEDKPVMCEAVSRDEARKLFASLGENFKLELLDAIPEGDRITLFTHGNWTDLCRGPHVQTTGAIKAFALTSLAGAYWRGDEKNPMLSRIYGTAFFSQKDLDDHLARSEEAKRRDHRKLGKELDLFSVNDDIGGGLVLWHPKGAMVRHLIETFWREKHLEQGYDIVYTPHVGRAKLWQTSGHLDFYREGMYSPMDIEGQEYYVKPMNCPFHMNIYGSRVRSYRELPLRFAELGTVYRFERSGVLHGLMRVRGFTQDDSHIFVVPEEMEAEVIRTLNFCIAILKTFGFTEFTAYIATRPEKSVGDPEKWGAATKALTIAAEKAGLKPEIDEGGGAFYGPKIDIKLKDAINREWQCSTIQFDFNLPERFDITYVGEDNQPHRPYVVHRALLGSIERFMGVLTEHYAGDFPMWLAPEQVRVLPIADRHNDAANALANRLKAKGLRASVDLRSDKLNKKIRDAEVEKVPYMLVLGDKDEAAGGATVRARHGETRDLGFKSAEELEKFLTEAARVPYEAPPV